MELTRRQGRRVPRRMWRLIAVLTAAGTLAAACGSTSPSSSAARARRSSNASSSTLKATAAEQSAVLKQIYWGGPVPTGLSKYVVDGMDRLAATKWTSAKEALAEHCFTAGSCTVGSGKDTLGILSTVPPDGWVNMVEMSTILEALTYPQIGKIIIDTNNADLSTTTSQIHAMISQGVSGIVSFDVFGAAAKATYQAATSAGIPVVLYQDIMGPSGKGVVTSQVAVNYCQLGQALAQGAAKALGSKGGNVALYTGVAGNAQAFGFGGNSPSERGWISCAKQWFAQHQPNIHVVDTSLTDWTEGGNVSATSALISSGKTVNAILYDDATFTTIISTYQNAHLRVPALIGWGQENDDVHDWITANKSFPMDFSSYYGPVDAPVAVSVLMDKLAGQSVPNEVNFPVVEYPVTASLYNSALPPHERVPAIPGMPSAVANWIFSR
jgi:ABC-type sugar transport system substrate-binding protein